MYVVSSDWSYAGFTIISTTDFSTNHNNIVFVCLKPVVMYVVSSEILEGRLLDHPMKWNSGNSENYCNYEQVWTLYSVSSEILEKDSVKLFFNS